MQDSLLTVSCDDTVCGDASTESSCCFVLAKSSEADVYVGEEHTVKVYKNYGVNVVNGFPVARSFLMMMKDLLFLRLVNSNNAMRHRCIFAPHVVGFGLKANGWAWLIMETIDLEKFVSTTASERERLQTGIIAALSTDSINVTLGEIAKHGNSFVDRGADGKNRFFVIDGFTWAEFWALINNNGGLFEDARLRLFFYRCENAFRCMFSVPGDGQRFVSYDRGSDLVTPFEGRVDLLRYVGFSL